MTLFFFYFCDYVCSFNWLQRIKSGCMVWLRHIFFQEQWDFALIKNVYTQVEIMLTPATLKYLRNDQILKFVFCLEWKELVDLWKIKQNKTPPTNISVTASVCKYNTYFFRHTFVLPYKHLLLSVFTNTIA